MGQHGSLERKLMKIYTKKGDAGETGLFGNTRVPKDDLRIRTYGTFDELNSFLGLSLADTGILEPLRSCLLRIQAELFQLGAELATPRGKDSGIQLVEESSILLMETEIDTMEKALQPLKTFILPGGSPSASILHIARTVCRRAERELTTLHRAEPQRAQVLQYLNRLSDYLFVAARFTNMNLGEKDVPWIAPHKIKP
jgi:cob(I)alamin adenosyltransferase